MRITKELANNIAHTLLQKKQKEIEAIEKDISRMVTEYYEALIPKAVIAFSKKHKGYLPMTQSVTIDNGYFHWTFFPLTKHLPKIENHSLLQRLEPEFNKKLQDIYHKKDEMKRTLKELINETVGTLLSLGTSKRIAEVFPEAAKLLPAEGSTTTRALAVNVESLRKRIA